MEGKTAVRPQYDVILADPPWKYDRTRFSAKDGRCPYSCMSIDEICAMPVASIAANNSSLFLWTTGPKMESAYRVIRAWGFQPITMAFVWIKTDLKRIKRLMGLGHWTRSCAEFVMYAKRGEPKRLSNRVSQLIWAPRRAHSEKPREIYSAIEQLVVADRRCELFARRIEVGWTAFGNDLRRDMFSKNEPTLELVRGRFQEVAA